MKIHVEGGQFIQLHIEHPAEWPLLDQIAADAIGVESDWLPDRMAGLMKDDEDWQEHVIPDLADHFSSQVDLVAASIQLASSNTNYSVEDYQAMLVIKREDADAWHGALNQARLALESQFRLSEIDGSVAEETLSHEVQSALTRSSVYLWLQGNILQYLMSFD